MSNYHLFEHQKNALTKVFENYKNGNSLSLIIMPAGSGKTQLATHIVKKFYEDYSLTSMAYISSQKVLQMHFKNRISEFTPLLKETVKSFTYKDIVEEIRNSTISKSQFQVLIFDDVDECNITNEVQLKEIFEYFNSQKICFARSELPKNNIFSNILNQNMVFKHTYKEAIKAGNFDVLQKIISNNLIEDFKNEVEGIHIGAVWSLDIKKNILNRIKLLEEENIESEKARKLIKSNNIDTTEIEEIGYKKKQLKEFTKLLNNNDYFDNHAKEQNGEEHVWQTFFEKNQWIFGFGLNFIFNTSLEGKKLEQTVAGYSVKGHGKRTDALLQTTGLIQTLCFGEIKTHRKSILKNLKHPYRSESWAISDELAGGIAQIQTTIQKSLHNISSRLSIPDSDGFEQNSIYLYKPKSFLILGSLSEFKNKEGHIHEDKFSSFKLFRRSISDVEIITFDELYERANAIVNKKWK